MMKTRNYEREISMDAQQISAVLFISGFAVLVIASLIGPRGIYQTPDLQRRLQIIDDNKIRWNIAQPLLGLGLSLTAVGFVVLAIWLSTLTNAWIPGLGAVAIVVGTISGLIFLYRQTIDPIGSYQGIYSGTEMLYYRLSLVGLLLFGVAFLQADLPAWLGYLTVGSTLLFGIVFLVSRERNGFLTPGLVVILSLVIAVFLLRQ